MSLYYLILWNQVDILQKHFKKDHVHIYAPMDEALRYIHLVNHIENGSKLRQSYM